MKPKVRRRLLKVILIVFLLLLVTATALFFMWRGSLRRNYPLKYSEQVNRYSAEFDLEPHLVYAIIRSESAFREHVVSPSGAVGLMQVMPSTAREIAGRLEMDEYSIDKLDNPDINIRLGCEYFRRLLDNFRDVECALAAYNAGPNKVEQWLVSAQYSDDGKTLKNIPYKETREYVRKVINSYEMYDRIYGKGK